MVDFAVKHIPVEMAVKRPLADRAAPSRPNGDVSVIAFAFRIGQRVVIDGDASIKATITGLAAFETGHEIRVEWMHAGCAHKEWFGASRLTLAAD